MDIVTHGMMGVVIAAPFMADYPEASIAFMMGSVAPDLDAMSRIAGRRSFLKFHQTYSHAFPVIAAIAAAAYVVSTALGFPGHHIALGLALGMCFHSVLDFSNTYGITLLAPFSNKRFCQEWVFFIDLPVIAVTVGALYVLYSDLARAKMPGLGLAYGYMAFLVVYWMVRIVLRRRAGRLAPEGTLSLLPTAFVPWKFIGARPLEGEVHLFDLSAVRGRLSRESLQKIHDGPYATILEAIPEYQAMRALSPLYHVVQVEKDEQNVTLTCRDLRTRNFDTRFGELRVTLDTGGTVDTVAACSLEDRAGLTGLTGWIRSEDLELASRLEKARPGRDEGVLLSPFDPLLWDRKRVQMLFAFEQMLEIFKPAHQRKYGYYCMPVLVGDELVGRCDLKADKAASRLHVLSVHHEGDGRRDAVQKSLTRYADALALKLDFGSASL